MIMPFWRPKDPQTPQERGAVEDAQMMALEASLPSDPAEIDRLYTYHLTMAARLRSERSAGLMARNALENAQVAHAEAEERYAPIRKMIEVFKMVGVPGVEVEILGEVEKNDTSPAPPVTLTDYVGMNPYIIFDKRYQVIDRVKGWVLPGAPIFDGENKELPPAQISLDCRSHWGVYDGSSDTFSLIRPLLVTETGGNWSGILTPAGITDGSIKGVVEDEGSSFQRIYERSSGNTLMREHSIKAVQYFAWNMQKTAEHYGYDAPAQIPAAPANDTYTFSTPTNLYGGVTQFDHDE